MTHIQSTPKFHITDRKVFDLFAITMVNAQNITWFLKARNGITIAPSGLGLFGYHVPDVPFGKTSTMKAQGGLQNVTLEVFNLKDSTPTEAVIEMVANVQNPSCTSITPLGDLSFDVVFDGALMGTLHAEDIPLELGSNLIPMNGVMKPDYSDPHIAEMSNLLMSNFIGGVDSHVVAIGVRGFKGWGAGRGLVIA